MRDETVVKVVTVVALAAVLLAAVVGVTLVAILTTRDLWKVEAMVFAGSLLVAAVGGTGWWMTGRRRRRRWHVDVTPNEESEDE